MNTLNSIYEYTRHLIGGFVTETCPYKDSGSERVAWYLRTYGKSGLQRLQADDLKKAHASSESADRRDL